MVVGGLVTTSATNNVRTEMQTDIALPAEHILKRGRSVGTTDKVKKNFELASILTKK